MYQTFLIKVPGRPNNKPLVILNALKQESQFSTNLFRKGTQMLSRTLSQVCNWVKCNCTPAKILRFAFCEKVSIGVAIVLVCAMWWHDITIADNIAAGKQVATDCLYAMPWGIVWAFRATISDFKSAEKGGKK